MAFTVRDFCHQSYRLINASNPTIPLHGDDQNLMITVLNQIMSSYASSGLMMTIARTVSVPVNLGISRVIFCDQNYPTNSNSEMVNLLNGTNFFTVADGSIYAVGEMVTGNGIPPSTFIFAISQNVITLSQNATFTGASLVTFGAQGDAVYIKLGRLANLDNAWLLLSGVTYPLICKSRDDYLAAWKYNPLQGLPRFAITFPETDYVSARLYPAPSQFFQFFARGKFQFSQVTSDDDLSLLPQYYILYFLYAVAKYTSKFKGRGSAWTSDLELEYRELKDNMEAASEVNLSIIGDEQSLLNGAYRVRAGI